MIRVFKDKLLTFTDYTANLNDYKAQTATIDIETTHYVYIGQNFPFNHLYFKFSTANDQACTIAIEYYDGKNWRDAVDVIDETILSSVSFGQSGFISWVPDKRYRWSREDTVKSDGTENISGLGNLVVYDNYWIRLSFSANLNAGTTLDWVGQIFLDDNDLYSEHPQLNDSDILDSVESGKTDWEEQRVRGTKLVIDDLKRREVIVHPGQVLEKEIFTNMAISRTAALIFNMLGRDYNEEKNAAMNEFTERKDIKVFRIDKNRDGRLDNAEITKSAKLRRR